jgi:hypothetical protein
VQGSGGVVVTGSGTTSNPYVISGGGVVAVADTSTINLTLTGTGSPGSPYTISGVAEVSLDELTDVDVAAATTGQGIVKQADGQWRGATLPTAPPGVINVSGGIEGDGSGGNPLSIKLAPNSGLTESAAGLAMTGSTGGAWSTYSPALTASGVTGPVAPTVGNGTLLGYYQQSGKMVDFNVTYTTGTTSTRGFGYWGLSLPVAAINIAGRRQILAAHASIPGIGDLSGTWQIEGGQIIRMHFAAGGKDEALRHAWPVSLPAGTVIAVSGRYEAA